VGGVVRRHLRGEITTNRWPRPEAGQEKNEDLSCPGIQNGPPLSIKKRPPTPSAAACSRESYEKSPLRRASAEAIPTRTRACARLSPPRKTRTCRTTTSNAPFC